MLKYFARCQCWLQALRKVREPDECIGIARHQLPSSQLDQDNQGRVKTNKVGKSFKVSWEMQILIRQECKCSFTWWVAAACHLPTLRSISSSTLFHFVHSQRHCRHPVASCEAVMQVLELKCAAFEELLLSTRRLLLPGWTSWLGAPPGGNSKDDFRFHD